MFALMVYDCDAFFDIRTSPELLVRSIYMIKIDLETHLFWLDDVISKPDHTVFNAPDSNEMSK